MGTVKKESDKKKGRDISQTGRVLETRKIRKDLEKLGKEYKTTRNPKKLTKIARLHYRLGELSDAKMILTRALQDDPNNPENYKYMADCLVVGDHCEQSLEYYRMSLALDNNDAEAITGYGHALMRLKRYEDAAQLFQDALNREDNAENNNNVGVLLFETKYFKQAAVYFQKAVSIAPQDKNYLINLAKAQFRSEQYDVAFFTLYNALKIDPDNAFIKAQLSNLGRQLKFSKFSQELKEALIACFKTSNIEHQNLSVVWLRLFLMDQTFNEIHSLTRLYKYEEFKDQANLKSLIPLMADDFFCYAVRLINNQAVDFEIYLKNLRHRILEYYINKEDENEQEIFQLQLFQLICCLAENLFMHEYPFSVSQEEIDAIERVKADIVTIKDKRAQASRIALLGCYRSLHEQTEIIRSIAKGLPSSLHVFWKSLLKLQIDEPLEERRIKEKISSLGTFQNEISREVRQQYEENPYPRWRYTNAQVDESKSFHFKKPYKILIAGCGTGKQVLQERYMYPNAHITAIDLSLSSIAYAKRKVDELGLDRITFYHADILELGVLEEKFDFIMCSGVIHHMQDPEAGLKVLLSLLKPKGLINLGLYSEYARKTVVALRELVAQKGWTADLEGIRAFRDYIAELPAEDHLRYVTRWRDYYMTSMVRDLVFHVQEHRYTFLQLEDMFQRHKLSFLTFSFIFPDVLMDYRRKHPAPEDFYNFKLWDAFEKKHPSSFASMYQLWLCRSEAKDSILTGPRIINALEM